MGKAENRVRSAKGEGQSNDAVMTPVYILETVIKTLGPIGLDPCSHPKSIVPSDTAVMLPQYYPQTARFAQRTYFGDGLYVQWKGHGLTWLNSPYSSPALELFLKKMMADHDEVVALVPVRTGNVYWPKTAGLADVEIRLPRVTHHGETTHSPFHSWLLYVGPRPETALGLGTLGDPRLHPRHYGKVSYSFGTLRT